MKIIATACAHDSSVCYLEDGEIKYWNKQERLSRLKRAQKPFGPIREIEERFDISDLDYYIITSPFQELTEDDLPGAYYFNWHSVSNPLCAYIDSFYPGLERYALTTHHLMHAANAFYNSGFDSAYVLVVDRNGSLFINRKLRAAFGVETETLCYCEYPCRFELVYQNPLHWVGITGIYALVSQKLGMGEMENGKTMALAAYGETIPGVELFDGYVPRSKNVRTLVTDGKILTRITGDFEFRSKLFCDVFPKDVKDEDLAHQAQHDATRAVLKLIDDKVDTRRCKNLCFTGGHAHNCLLNYEIVNTFADLEFYPDPIPDDAGTSIGAAKYWWYYKTQSMEKFPLECIFNCG